MCCKSQRKRFAKWLADANSNVRIKEDKSINPLSVGILFFTLASALLSTNKLDTPNIIIICIAITLTALFSFTCMCLRAARSLIGISWIQKYRYWFYIIYIGVFIHSWITGSMSGTTLLSTLVFYLGLVLFTLLYLVVISRSKVEIGIIVAFIWGVYGVVYLIQDLGKLESWIYFLVLATTTFLVATRLWKIWNKLPI